MPASGCPDWLLLASEVDETAVAQADEMLVELQAAACGASLGMVPTGHGFSIWSQVSHRIFEFVRTE